jgi:hypothetical protein
MRLTPVAISLQMKFEEDNMTKSIIPTCGGVTSIAQITDSQNPQGKSSRKLPSATHTAAGCTIKFPILRTSTLKVYMHVHATAPYSLALTHFHC